MSNYRRMVLQLLLVLAFLTGAGCAVHYVDSATGTEHIWGIGHMAMRVSAPNEGVKALGVRTDSLGILIGSADKELQFGAGWNARQRIEIVDENTALCISWPNGSLYNARVGSRFPFELDYSSDSGAREEKP